MHSHNTVHAPTKAQRDGDCLAFARVQQVPDVINELLHQKAALANHCPLSIIVPTYNAPDLRAPRPHRNALTPTRSSVTDRPQTSSILNLRAFNSPWRSTRPPPPLQQPSRHYQRTHGIPSARALPIILKILTILRSSKEVPEPAIKRKDVEIPALGLLQPVSELSGSLADMSVRSLFPRSANMSAQGHSRKKVKRSGEWGVSRLLLLHKTLNGLRSRARPAKRPTAAGTALEDSVTVSRAVVGRSAVTGEKGGEGGERVAV